MTVRACENIGPPFNFAAGLRWKEREGEIGRGSEREKERGGGGGRTRRPSPSLWGKKARIVVAMVREGGMEKGGKSIWGAGAVCRAKALAYFLRRGALPPDGFSIGTIDIYCGQALLLGLYEMLYAHSVVWNH